MTTAHSHYEEEEGSVPQYGMKVITINLPLYQISLMAALAIEPSRSEFIRNAISRAVDFISEPWMMRELVEPDDEALLRQAMKTRGGQALKITTANLSRIDLDYLEVWIDTNPGEYAFANRSEFCRHAIHAYLNHVIRKRKKMELAIEGHEITLEVPEPEPEPEPAEEDGIIALAGRRYSIVEATQ